MTEKFSVAELIEQAIQTEKVGADFYARLSEKFGDKELKSLFIDLSVRERQHAKSFAELLEIIRDDTPSGDWSEIAPYMRAIAESQFFLGSGKSLSSMLNVKSKKEAIEKAIAFEKETLLYFIGMRSVVKEKDVIDEIINEEKSHLARLKAFSPKDV
jgi:rubrerythrin